jgi:hypothetical protein
MHILTNVYRPLAEGNLCDENGIAHKPVSVEDYSQNMGYTDKGIEQLIVIQLAREHGSGHLQYFTIVNSYIILTSDNSKTDHQKLCPTLV